MSYPGYGYGGAGPTYPPYPNNPSAPHPEHATANLSYPNVGFQTPQQPSYPSYPSAMPQPGSRPSQSPYPPSHPGPVSYPPAAGVGAYPCPYPPAGLGGSTPYPYLSTVGGTPTPYPPAPGGAAYPHAAGATVNTPQPMHGSSFYPQAPASAHAPHSHPHNPSMNPYPPVANLYTSTPAFGGHNSGPIRKGNPTVRPVQPFDPRSDAEILRKAMKGFGTDEKAIIDVLAKRSNAQRQDIALQFKTLYGKDLVSDLKSELGGKFEDLVVAMMMPLPNFLAKEVHDAIAGIGTDEDTIVEVICSATNQEIHTLKAAYQHMYNRTLEDDLRGDTSGNFKRLMVSLCVGNRSENYNVDPAAAQADAQALLRAGELRVGTDESTFNAVLCQRSYPQLQAVIVEYQRITGHSLEKAIRKEFSGDIADGLVTILKCAENRPGFFAERLYKSMKGMGTDDRALIRLVVSRCEIDMGDIKQAFSIAYKKGLDNFITGDCSGDYKKCLLALIGA